MHPVFRGIFGLFALVFVYAGYLQLNDPDPILWVATYAISAGLCALAAGDHPAPTTFPFTIAGIAIGWAIYLATFYVYGDRPVTAMYAHGHFTGNILVDSEEGREMGGLLVIATAMVLLIAAQIYERYGSHGRDRDRRR